MSVSIYVEVSGRTYDVKEKLKSLGLRWNGDRKVWKGTVSEEALRELGELADKFPIEIKTRRKRHELTYEDEVDHDLLEKVYAIVGEKIKAVIPYANPYSHYVHDRKVVFTAGELKDGKVKVVARVKGNKGEVLLSENAYKKTAKELLEKAQRVYKSVEDYRLENYLEFLREKEEAERYRYTNSTWVRCWECGRLIPPGQATKDFNGAWYCGC